MPLTEQETCQGRHPETCKHCKIGDKARCPTSGISHHASGHNALRSMVCRPQRESDCRERHTRMGDRLDFGEVIHSHSAHCARHFTGSRPFKPTSVPAGRSSKCPTILPPGPGAPIVLGCTLGDPRPAATRLPRGSRRGSGRAAASPLVQRDGWQER